MTIEVVKPGPQTSIQDGGRHGYLHTGLSPAGPMDHLSLRIASLLVGNDLPPPLFVGGPRGDAGLEFTLIGPTLKFHDEALIALAGAEMPAKLNGAPIALYESIHVPAGAVLELGSAKGGVRTYLAVAGGIDVPPVLGSRAQNLFASRGPLGGRALRAGDRLPLKRLAALDGRRAGRRFDRARLQPRAEIPTLRVVMGPQDGLFADESVRDFLSELWKLSMAANRTGMRFRGPQLRFKDRPRYLERDAGADPSNIVDDVIPVGGIQCPSGIEAIVMGTENPTVGGFAKIATVISADLAVAGQMRPGETARFAAIPVDEALAIARAAVDLVHESHIH